jgi:hypothetical protein
MKPLSNLIVFFVVSSFLFVHCKQKMESKTETPERPVMVKVDTTNMEYSSMYICPMHCKGSGSDKPGVCPVCGMDYELNESYQHPTPDSTRN